MSCHISALCIALPCPKSGLVEPTEEFMEVGSPIVPLQSTDNTSASPSTVRSWGRGGGTFLGDSTFHVTPQFLTKKEEFSTCPSSGLSWRDKQHVQGESCGKVTYFQVSVQTQCPPWRIRSQTRRRSCVATPVSSTVGAKSLRAHSPQKGFATKLLILS